MSAALGLIFAAIAVWLLWPRSEPEPKQDTAQIEPGILAWEQDCAERKAAGQWNWGKQ